MVTDQRLDMIGPCAIELPYMKKIDQTHTKIIQSAEVSQRQAGATQFRQPSSHGGCLAALATDTIGYDLFDSQ